MQAEQADTEAHTYSYKFARDEAETAMARSPEARADREERDDGPDVEERAMRVNI
jgi:hypothetical protein